MPVTKSTFDQANNVTLFTITNASNQLTVKVADYGATLVSVIFADRSNTPRDLVLGFDDLAGYQSKALRNPYFGASIGRVANRIANASFALNGHQYQLYANNGANSLHGGAKGFDKRKWSLVGEDAFSVTLSLKSESGEEGYPGAVTVQIKFSVTGDNELHIEYSAKLQEDQSVETIVNLTNHTYFNLNGVFSNESSKILDHLVLMQAGKYLPVEDNLIPTGTIAPVAGTLLDFSDRPHTIGERTYQVAANGYDHCFVLDDDQFRIDPGPLKKAVEVFAPLTGIKLTMSTTEPAFQFYAGSKIVDGHKPKKSQTTDPTVRVGSYSGFCLEAQRFPDAVNKEEWREQVTLSGGQQYTQTTVYKLELADGI